MAMQSDTDSVRDYFERLDERRCANSNSEAMKCCLWKMARSADRHLERFELAARRYQRAVELNDRSAIAFERDTMLALLYEAADTVYIITQLFDPDYMDLNSSSDGVGWAGEDAHFVLGIFDTGERVCAKVLKFAKEYNLSLNFKKAVDEREGLTYQTHAHWRDLVPGSIEKSFFSYFAQAQKGVTQRLNQVPKFWQHQTLKQAIAKSTRAALREIIFRLQMASFPQVPLSGLVEKQTLPDILRHWSLGQELPSAEHEPPIIGRVN